MKKRKKLKSLLIFVLIFAIVLCGSIAWRFKDRISDIFYKEPNGELLTQICKCDGYNATLVNMTSNSEILKIDYIMPGLDDYTLSTVIWSVKASKVAYKNTFGTASFSTDVLNSGFYVANTTEKKVDFYTNEGKLSKSVKIDTQNSISEIAVSKNGKYISFTDTNDAKVNIYDLKTGKTERLFDVSGWISCTAMPDGDFCYLTGNNSYILADAETLKYETFSFEMSPGVFTPSGMVITNDNGYDVYGVGNKNKTEIMPQSIVEAPITCSVERVFTVAGNEKGDTITAYSLKNGDYAELELNAKLDSVHDMGNGYAAVATFYDSEVPDIWLYNLKAAKWVKNHGSSARIPYDESTVSNTAAVNSGNGKILQDVPVISQFPDFPTGCETISAIIAIKYAGDNITAEEFCDNYLKKSSNFYFKDGKRYGPDPYESFIGSPKNENAYGCMAPVIERAMNAYYKGRRTVVNDTGTELSALCGKYTDRGIPCLVWVSINMIEPYYTRTWYLENGETYRWLANEHCMVLIGYDSDYYYFSDPYAGAVVKYQKQIAEERYKAFGMQALAIEK